MIRWFIIYPLIALFILAASWRYLPGAFQKQIGAFVGLGVTRSTGTIKTVSGEEIALPEKPKERRRALIGELKKSVEELKRQISGEQVSPQEGKNPTEPTDILGAPLSKSNGSASVNTEKTLQVAEKIIKELEGTNEDSPIRELIVERILNTLLPEKEVECKLK